MVQIGDSVILVDEFSREHHALVTNVWGIREDDPDFKPGINAVFVVQDDGKTDPYGRQIDRKTSVVHQSNQTAPGLYWREP